MEKRRKTIRLEKEAYQNLTARFRQKIIDKLFNFGKT